MTQFEVKDFKDVLSLVELQRELTLRLHYMKEMAELRLKETKRCVSVGTAIAQLKSRVGRKFFSEISTLTEEEIKEINKLLKDRHIKI